MIVSNSILSRPSCRAFARKWPADLTRRATTRPQHAYFSSTARRQHGQPTLSPNHGKTLLTLAIETSCDDTCVAVLEKRPGPGTAARLLHHARVTADNRAYRGIHPLVAVSSHSAHLADMVSTAVRHHLPRTPDFVAVTRGPGMPSPLAAGLNTAKGLAAAWQVPMVGVHHMQAHALTPRLVEALARSWDVGGGGQDEPRFPFLTLLASGGHTLLLRSAGLTDHVQLAQTETFAVGDVLDKCARAILPPSAHDGGASYGPALERFAFPGGAADYEAMYTPPGRRCDEVATVQTRYGWGLRPPMAESREMKFEFGGLHAAVIRLVKERETAEGGLGEDERRTLAREVMRLVFEHLGSRVLFTLDTSSDRGRGQKTEAAGTLVLSGGVASNGFLRHVLRRMLDVRGHPGVGLVAPPVELCTDNAAMIAWAGMEMFEAGWTTDLGVVARRKWPLDPGVEGGVLGTEEDGWLKDGGRWTG